MPKRKVLDPSEPCPMDIDEPCKGNGTKRRKTYIPKALKIAVWQRTIGLNVGSTLCVVCKTNTINQMDFHCGHIQAEAEGGDTCLSNLVPVCSKCNLSMGKRNMLCFKNAYFH